MTLEQMLQTALKEALARHAQDKLSVISVEGETDARSKGNVTVTAHFDHGQQRQDERNLLFQAFDGLTRLEASAIEQWAKEASEQHGASPPRVAIFPAGL